MSRNVRVGFFVIAGLILSGLVIFLIGDERLFFSSSSTFTTRFADVQGLKSGAPIRMNGIDVGHVSKVGYGEGKDDDGLIHVELSIVKASVNRVRTDRKATIATKGLLGDKMIDLAKRSDEEMKKAGAKVEPIKPGGEVPHEDPEDMFGKVEKFAGKAEDTLGDVRLVAKSLANEDLHKNIRGSVASLNTIMKEIAEGEGYPHLFLSDKTEAQRISRTLDNLERTSAELNATLQEVRMVAARVRTGPGFAHDIIYGDGPKKEIAQFGSAAEELAVSLKGIRQSDSFVHDMLYGGKGTGAGALSDIAAITSDLRVIVAGVKQGKGTIGALLVDPSVYEDLKLVLGNVERNDVLRALVRYSIKQDEKKPTVEVKKP